MTSLAMEYYDRTDFMRLPPFRELYSSFLEYLHAACPPLGYLGVLYYLGLPKED